MGWRISNQRLANTHRNQINAGGTVHGATCAANGGAARGLPVAVSSNDQPGLATSQIDIAPAPHHCYTGLRLCHVPPCHIRQANATGFFGTICGAGGPITSLTSPEMPARYRPLNRRLFTLIGNDQRPLSW